MAASAEELRPLIQACALWLKNYMEFFFDAEPAPSVGWIEGFSSADKAPSYVKIFVFFFQLPDISR